MASVTKSNDGKQPADGKLPDRVENAPQAEVGKGGKSGSGGKGGAVAYAAPSTPSPSGPNFFTIYKKGQGYWTRLGTTAGAILLGALITYNIYAYLPTFWPTPDTSNLPADQVTAVTQSAQQAANRVAIGTAAAFAVLYSLIVWRLINKPTNVDFLIATDSEMKKVNWTSRKELIGSTKVVIVFMFLIAMFLFLIDILFSYFFYLITVLKSSPFGGGGTIGGG